MCTFPKSSVRGPSFALLYDMKMTVFWEKAPCSLDDVDGRFTGT